MRVRVKIGESRQHESIDRFRHPVIPGSRSLMRNGHDRSIGRDLEIARRKPAFRRQQMTTDESAFHQLVRSTRSEEHTSELQSHSDLVCRLLLEKKKKKPYNPTYNKKKQRTQNK